MFDDIGKLVGNASDAIGGAVDDLGSTVRNAFGTDKGKASRTKQKFNKISGVKDLSKQGQVVFPKTLLNGIGNGNFVLFNINRLKASSYSDTNTKVEGQSPVVESGLGNEPVFYTRGYSIQSALNGGGRYVRSNESIILPLPESIATSYGIEWNAVELGLAGRLAREIATFDQTTTRDLANALMEGLKNSTTGAIESLTGINAKQTAELYTGTIQNPFLEVLFKGVRTREAPMEWIFAPKNAEESSILAEVIRRFKFHAHPEFKYNENDSSFFLYPSTFDITFMKVEGDSGTSRNVWLHRLTTCALTNITHDSTVSGPSFHRKDNSPTAIKFGLNFTELSPLRKTDFESVEDSF